VTRYRFFAGKGGAGKTTCAAGAALAAAESGERTLVVSTDPAHSLGDALEQKLSAAPRLVRGRLFAAELDASKALRRFLAPRSPRLRAIAVRGTWLDEEDIDSLFELSLPGVDELIALLELERLAAGFDCVVVDTAPTGHTLRLLEMPETLDRTAQVLDDMQAKHRAMALSLRGFYRPDASDAAIDELRARAQALRALLRDEADFSWVMLPEPMSLEETKDGVAALLRAGLRVSRLVANRATGKPASACGRCSVRRAAEALVLREALSLELPVVLLPAQETEPRGLAALRRIGRALRAKPLARIAAPARAAAARRIAQNAAERRRPAPGAGAALANGEGWLETIAPAGTRLVFFGGKGGVGKTTAATTCALALARSGRATLLLSTDPAHSLADALELPLGDDEREVPLVGHRAAPDSGHRAAPSFGNGRGGARERPAAPRLLARELDATLAFSREREKYRRSVDELFDALRGGSRFDAPYDRAVVQDLIELAPPGLDELFGLLGLSDALSSGRFDAVVVDTAPTGHALRLLELPEKALAWVHALLAILLKYRKVVGLGELAASLTRTARELRELDALLRDPARTRFVAVTRASALPRLETARLLKALRRLRVPGRTLLVNALTPPGCPRCSRAARAEERELAILRRSARGWAMLGAPERAAPPRGRDALEQFGRTWAMR
jgi:arsenite-transporting ATPase